MKRSINSLTILLCLSLTGCATPKMLVPTGGSRADGIVELSFEKTEFEKPILDREQAYQTAKSRCQAWHYKDADLFSGYHTHCEAPGGLTGCMRTMYTIKYQCTGK